MCVPNANSLNPRNGDITIQNGMQKKLLLPQRKKSISSGNGNLQKTFKIIIFIVHYTFIQNNNRKSRIPNVMSFDNKEFTKPQDIVNCFADFFYRCVRRN